MIENEDKKVYKFRMKESTGDLAVHIIGLVDMAEDVPFFRDHYCQVSYPIMLKDYTTYGYPHLIEMMNIGNDVEEWDMFSYYRQTEVLFGNDYISFSIDHPYIYLKETEFTLFGRPSEVEVKRYSEIVSDVLTPEENGKPLPQNVVSLKNRFS